jgi:WD40 repeat protein
MSLSKGHLFGVASLLALCSSSPGEVPGGTGQAPATDLHGDPLPHGALARLGTVRLRQPFVRAVAFSPDGRVLASGGYDSRVIFWDPRTGEEVGSLVGHRNFINALAFSRDGRLLASGCQDSEIRVWDTATGEQLQRIQSRGPLTTVAFSPDGKLLASSGQDNAVRVWEADTGKELQCFQEPLGHYVHVVAFSPDGKVLAAARTNMTIDLWEVAGWKHLGSLRGHKERVTALAFSPDGSTLFTGAFDTTVRFWDVSGRQELQCLGDVKAQVGGSDPLIQSLAVAPDGRSVAAGRQDGAILLWDTQTGEEVCRWPGDSTAVMALAFSPDGKVLAAASRHGIRLWDPDTGKRKDHLGDLNGRPGRLLVSADGKFLAAHDDRQVVRVFEMAGRKECATVTLAPYCLMDLALSPDSRVLAFAEVLEFGKPAGRVRLVDLATGKEKVVLPTQPNTISTVAFSQRGDTVAAYSLANVILWDPESGKERLRFPGPGRSAPRLLYPPDGRALAIVGQEEAVSLWDPSSGKKIRSFGLRDGGQGCLAFSPDGKTVATTYGSEVILWEAATGQQRCRLRGHRGPVNTAAFSPDGKLVATAAREETIRLWSVSTGEEVGRLTGHRGWVESLAFSPLDGTLISGSIDTTILFWDPWSVLAPRKKPAEKLGQERLTALWGDLARPDAAQAHRAIGMLAEHPDEAAPFLSKTLPKELRSDPQMVMRLIAELDDDRFDTREQASQELARLGHTVEPALRRALEGQTSAEARQRLKQLLEKLEGRAFDPARISTLRAVEALERMDTESAREVLRALRTGIGSVLAEEADAALQRLARRPRTTPGQ